MQEGCLNMLEGAYICDMYTQNIYESIGGYPRGFDRVQWFTGPRLPLEQI